MHDKGRIKAACQVAGCQKEDLMKSRLTDGAVVLIITPGRKVVIPFADLEQERAPVSDVIEGLEPPTFVELVPKRIMVILEHEGLTDPATLRGMSDEDLIAVKGLGPGLVRDLREALRLCE